MVRVPGRGTGFFVAPQKILTCSHLFDANLLRCNLSEVMWKDCKGTALVTRKRTMESPSLPDLALLDVTWQNGGRGHPCVLLNDEMDVDGDSFFVFGHPAGDFSVNGDGLRFDFGVEIVDNFGTKWIKVKDDLATEGYSGSPLLNLRLYRVSGVVARNISPQKQLSEPEPFPSALSSMLFPNFVNLTNKFHLADNRWRDLLPGRKLWSVVERNCFRYPRCG